MDNHVRAEKIIEQFSGNTFSNAEQAHAWLKTAITSQLDEAVAEEFAQGALDQQRRCSQHREQQRQEGYAAAREQAAVIAENTLDDHWLTLSNNIRSMQPPSGEGQK